MEMKVNDTIKLDDIVRSAVGYLASLQKWSDSKAAYICIKSKSFQNDSKNSG